MNNQVRLYITKNRISPFVGVLGEWPNRANLIRSCNAGFHLWTRIASDYEQSIIDNAIRHPAVSYSSLLSMLRDQKYKMPKDHYRMMIRSLREAWPLVKGIIKISFDKRIKK